MANADTWHDPDGPRREDFPAETVDPNGGPLLPRPSDTLGGRTTVLPRVEVAEGGAPRLVEAERPRFESIGPLGEGGLGVVVAAKDLDIGRRVAIKRIRPDRATQGAFLRFVQEVRTVGRLDHPNIVPVHDVGKDEHGGFYFVMKYVEGETLAALIERLRSGDRAAHLAWGFERRLALFVQILHAVEFAHARGVIHRDLKPANVMIGRHGEVQLLDWGVARQVDGAELAGVEAAGDDGPNNGDSSLAVTKTRVGSVIGTPHYMSPEQARGEVASVQFDTWALSMLLVELLSLSHPLEDRRSFEEVSGALASWQTPRASGLAVHPAQGPVPADLGWIACDGLRAQKADRYVTVGALLHRIERRNAGDFPVQCPITLQKQALARTSRFVDRRPITTLFLVGGTAAGAVVGVCALAVGGASLLVGGFGLGLLL